MSFCTKKQNMPTLHKTLASLIVKKKNILTLICLKTVKEWINLKNKNKPNKNK